MGGFGGGFGGKGGGYGQSQQYMPNAGLMSGYSTGFGPYGGYQRPRFGGGYQRPRFGGGKGGMNRPMGGGKGGGYGGGYSPYGSSYNPYGTGGGYSPYGGGYGGGYSPYGGGYQTTGQSYEDVVGAGNGGINPVIGPNGEGLFDSPPSQPNTASTFDRNLQHIIRQVEAGTATPGQQRYYDERYLTGEYLNNPNYSG